MIAILGSAGSGKSLQGQLLAARMGWRWLSVGQLLRDTKDRKILRIVRAGKLVDSKIVNPLVRRAIVKAEKDGTNLILDGYLRNLDQTGEAIENGLKLAIVMDVDRKEVLKRLRLRGRADDERKAIEERLDIFNREIEEIESLLKASRIKVVHVDGNATVGVVHDRIAEQIKKCHLM